MEEIANRTRELKKLYNKNDIVLNGLDKLRVYLFEGLLGRCGFEYLDGEGHEVKVLRTLVVSVLGNSGHQKTIEFLKQRMQLHLVGDKSKLHPEFRGLAFGLFLENSTQPTQDFETILEIVKNGASLDERLAGLSALGSIAKSADIETIKHILQTVIFDQNVIKSQDFPSCLGGFVGANCWKVNEYVFDWYFENWPKLHKRFQGSMGLLSSITNYSLKNMIGNEFITIVDDWYQLKGLAGKERDEKEKELESVKRPLEQCLETLRINTRWYDKDVDGLVEFFKEFK